MQRRALPGGDNGLGNFFKKTLDKINMVYYILVLITKTITILRKLGDNEEKEEIMP
jgi:hypothetical protein